MLSPMVSKIGLNIEKPLFFNLHPQFTKFWPQIQDKPGKNNPFFHAGLQILYKWGDFLLHLVTNSSKIRGIVEAI